MNAPSQTLICNPQIERSELLSVSFRPFRVSSHFPLWRVCAFDREKILKEGRKKRKEKNERRKVKKKTNSIARSGFELALLHRLLASRARNFTTQPRKQNTRYVRSLNIMSRSSDPVSEKETLLNIGFKCK